MNSIKRFFGLHVCYHAGPFKRKGGAVLICYECGREKDVKAEIL